MIYKNGRSVIALELSELNNKLCPIKRFFVRFEFFHGSENACYGLLGSDTM
jgi:hypothetical protein